ncbi:MAG: glycoside hydrolase family 28 protein, partial [Bacteroidota bacterium]
TFRSAIAIESVDGGILENILIDSIEATNTGNAIFIKLGHRVEGEVATLKNVTIQNVKVEVAFGRPDHAYEVRGPDLPFFHNTMPSSITGFPGHRVENVTLRNIEITYPGRGNKGLAYRPLSMLEQVPENETHYPEFSMFGELPAWGFFIRHVKGVAFDMSSFAYKRLIIELLLSWRMRMM